MLKAILTLVLAGALLWTGWHYVSPRTRDAILGFIGMAQRRDTAEVQRMIGDSLLPEDPAERRVALTADLDARIRELRRREVAAAQGSGVAAAAGLLPDPEFAAVPTPDILAGASQAVRALEEVNKDASVKTKVTERILDRILPARQCSQ